MTGVNNVTFGFDNSREHIESNKDKLFKILNETFSWSFSSEGISGTVEKATENFTTLEGYFVNPSDDYKPQTQLEIATEYDKKFDELYVKLHRNLDIILDATRGFTGATTDDWTNPDTQAGMIVGSVTGGLLVITGLFLLTAYCLRTKALERRVKAMDTAAVDTHGSNNQAFQQNNLGVPNIMEIPGSNEFAGSGANPIFQAAMDAEEFTEDDLQFLEEMSDYSGDSILIGVEEQTEFNDYKEKVQEADMDMDLYNKMWGNFKKMDDYHADDDKDDDEIPVQRKKSNNNQKVDTYF